MLSDYKILPRIMGLLGIVVILMLIIGGMGGIGMNKIRAGLRTVYEDRVVPLQQLKEVSDAYAVYVVDASHKVQTGIFTTQQGLDNIAKAQSTINAQWDAYINTTLTPEEKTLVEDAKGKMGTADSAIAELRGILQTGDLDALMKFRTEQLYQKIDPVTDDIGKLVNIQLKEAKNQYGVATTLYKTLLFSLIGIAVAAIAVGAWMARKIGQSIKQPLDDIIGVMDALKAGKLDTHVSGADRIDEVGDVARAVEIFRLGMIDAETARADQERARIEQEEAKEKLRLAEAEAERRKAEEESARAREQAERAQRLSSLAADFDRNVSSLLGAVSSASTELNMTAQSMTRNADQASHQATVGASASEETAVNVETVATATEELSASIQEISRQVQRSAQIADRAVSDAGHTSELVGQLSNAATKINEVVALIEAIASQTNLLALNATIEAARAGEAGKGFAVVASEVKALADETAKATGEIASQIGSIQGATEKTVAAIAGIRQTIIEINDIAGAVAAAVEEQGAATNEISRNVQQAAEGTRQVSATITTVTAAVNETGHSASEVLQAAGELSIQSEKLKADVSNFLVQIQAA